MLHPLALDLLQEFQGPRTDALVFGNPQSLIQGCALPMPFLELLLPEKERSPADFEGIHCRREAVLLPED